MTFAKVIIQALGLIGIIQFLGYDMGLGGAGGHFWRDAGIITAVALVAFAPIIVAIAHVGSGVQLVR